MAASIKSAGKAAPATSGASATRQPRHKPAPTEVPARLLHHRHAFEAVDIAEGHRRGAAAAFAALRQARELNSTSATSHEAFALLRDLIAEAGVARSANDGHGRDAAHGHRAWAGSEALRPMVEMVLWALPYFDFDEWERQTLERLEQDDAHIAQEVATQRAAFVQRMRQGRERRALEARQ